MGHLSHQFWWFVQPFLTWFTGEHIVSVYQTKYQAATGWSNVPILEWATPSLTVWLLLLLLHHVILRRTYDERVCTSTRFGVRRLSAVNYILLCWERRLYVSRIGIGAKVPGNESSIIRDREGEQSLQGRKGPQKTVHKRIYNTEKRIRQSRGTRKIWLQTDEVEQTNKHRLRTYRPQSRGRLPVNRSPEVDIMHDEFVRTHIQLHASVHVCPSEPSRLLLMRERSLVTAGRH